MTKEKIPKKKKEKRENKKAKESCNEKLKTEHTHTLTLLGCDSVG
jgi:hypothetical protein